MDVQVEVGSWEHECCGPAYERGGVVELSCVRYVAPDGVLHLVEVRHEARPERWVRGRVTDVAAVFGDGTTRAILRVPSGSALRGFDDDDDGHLEDPWTHEVVEGVARDFVLTVRA